MKLLPAIPILTLFIVCIAPANAQQGDQGRLQAQQHDAAAAIDSTISTYLFTAPVASILTPGDSVQYQLPLKSGQVVIADATSDAFDPALQIDDSAGKPVASNDDRYPGDQRPLLLWRCTKDGTYTLAVSCFHNRAGGQFHARFQVFSSADISDQTAAPQTVDVSKPFLLRVPMEAGQIKAIAADGNRQGVFYHIGAIIGPDGLPCSNLAQPLQPIITRPLFMAPVSGDYYVLAQGFGSSNLTVPVTITTETITPAQPSAALPANAPGVWEVTVKKGDLLRFDTADTNVAAQLQVTEKPDISAFDLKDPSHNPFMPPAAGSGPSPAFDLLPARAGDPRVLDLFARRDATLWVATSGFRGQTPTYHLTISPASTAFTANGENQGTLHIGDTDYWAFDGQPGEVLSLATNSPTFRASVSLREPSMQIAFQQDSNVDQSIHQWNYVVQTPGRYLVAISCMGDGGSGRYTLSRKSAPPHEFSISSPGTGTVKNGETQVWKFTATPAQPLLMHWFTSGPDASITVYNDGGTGTFLQRQPIDDHNAVGIVKVDRPTTFLIVVTGTGNPLTFKFRVGPLPA